MNTDRQHHHAAITGVAALGLSLATASLAAAVLKVDGPVNLVGNRFIDSTPKWLKTWAIDAFGTADKAVLKLGVFVVLCLVAAGIGAASMKRRSLGLVGTAALTAVGLLAAVTRSGRQSADWLALALGGLVGAGALWVASKPPASGPSESPVAYDRRRFIVSGAAMVGGAGVLGLAGSAVRRSATHVTAKARSVLQLPTPRSPAPAVAATADVGNGVSPYITPTADFYRIDTALAIPNIDAALWNLKVSGMVERPTTLTYADILAMPMVERLVTLSCVSNDVGGDLVGNAIWLGVPLADILNSVGVKPGATQLASKSVDGWTCGFPTALALDGRNALLAVGMNGEPLTPLHGYPCRLVIPGIYGYVSATKWLSDIMLTTFEDFDGYWIDKGWAKEGPIKTQSRIDVPRRGNPLVAGPIPIAGVAWAVHRGISKVEVRIDKGPWNQARLADEPTVDGWRQWIYEWNATAGKHTLQVRATDGLGVTQTETIARSDPDGATGWHTVGVTIAA